MIDRLVNAIQRTNNPTVVGLDTRLEYLPPSFIQKFASNQKVDIETACEAIYAYNSALVDALCDLVPCVKVQVAYYEMYGVLGLQAFQKTLAYAKQKGMITIADVKRNDIGATAAAYSSAYLGKTAIMQEEMEAFPSDFATVNPYLGSDGIVPFLQDMQKYDKGIFILVKTSNPSSGEFQDLQMQGRTLYEIVGDYVADWGKPFIGKSGYSDVGAVVGATYPSQGETLRKRLPNTFFLVPGYGAQGATAKDLMACFDENGQGAIVNASRSILCAYKKQDTDDFVLAAKKEALRMRDDINLAIGMGKNIK